MHLKSPVDIKTLIQTSTIEIYDKNKFIEKLYQNFNEEEQKLYICNLYLYLNYHSVNEFIINLDNIWKFIGFSNKANAKRLLKQHFTENIDYKIALIRWDERKNEGGFNQETIMLNINTFKKLCLKANTKNADKIHDYYIKLEMIYNELMKEEIEKKESEKKEIEAQKRLLEIELEEKSQTLNVLTKKTNKFIAGESVYIFRSTFDNKNIYKVGRTKNCNERENNHKTATFDGEIIHQVLCSNSNILEKVSHFLLDKYRFTSKREWFFADFNTMKNAVDYAKIILDTDIDLEKNNLLDMTKSFIHTIQKHKITQDNDKTEEGMNNSYYKFTELNLKEYIHNKDNFEMFIEYSLDKDSTFSVSYTEIKNQYKIWSKTANHNQLKNMIEYMKTKFTTTMKKANPLVSTSKVTGFFNGIKIKEEFYKFEKPESENLIIEKYLNECCQRGPGYRMTIQEFNHDFEKYCEIIGIESSFYTKEKVKNYFDILFVRLRKGISNSNIDYRLGGWLGVSLLNNIQPEPIYSYKPKNRKIVKAYCISTNNLIKEWPSISDASYELKKARTIVSNIIKRHMDIVINNISCYLTY